MFLINTLGQLNISIKDMYGICLELLQEHILHVIQVPL